MNTVYQEVVNLPFNSESGTISKNSFSCLMNIVTCDREVGKDENRLYEKRDCDKIVSTVPFL
ncbi:hypothetical protein B1P84_00340 [Enterococcus faecium]|nr:hypothetical protein B1P84_00340 [Enterococcus faecium]